MDAFQLTVFDRASRIPAFENGFNRQFQLLHRILRERFARVLFERCFVGFAEFFHALGWHVVVIFDFVAFLDLLEFVLEDVMADVHYNVAIHVDQTPVGIECKTAVTGGSRQTFD